MHIPETMSSLMGLARVTWSLQISDKMRGLSDPSETK
jgi:hypothetical protein